MKVNKPRAHHELVASNARLIGNLALAGHPVTDVIHVQAALEALIDVVCDTPEKLEEFHLASDMALHSHLWRLLKEAEDD